MNKFHSDIEKEKEKVAVFLVRLSLELKKNSTKKWNSHFNRFI